MCTSHFAIFVPTVGNDAAGVSIDISVSAGNSVEMLYAMGGSARAGWDARSLCVSAGKTITKVVADVPLETADRVDARKF